MILRARTALALSIAVALSIGACSDSTVPRPPHFAQFLDSLYFSTLSDSTLTENVRDSRSSIISYFEVGAAFDVPPKTITMTTATGTEQWSAYEILSVQSRVNGEYINLLVATRDLHFRTYLYAEYASDGSITVGALTNNDTVRTGLSSHEGSSTVSLDGSHACPTPVPLSNPTISLVNCSTAKFSSSGSIEFNDAPGLERAYRHLSFPTTSFEGERFFYN
jgi:hypothetical protein